MNKKLSLLSLFCVLAISACGGDSSSSGGSVDGVSSSSAEESYDSVDDLPNCGGSREGMVAKVETDSLTYVCLSKIWEQFDYTADIFDDLPSCTSNRKNSTALIGGVDRLVCDGKLWSETSAFSSSSERESVKSSSSMQTDGSSDSSGSSDDDSSDNGPVESLSISGVSQKGPFLRGAKVTAYELQGNKSLTQTGRTFGGEIVSNDGKFSMSNVSLVSSYVRLEANGFYRNEVTGGDSDAPISLNAYTDLSARSKVNVNLLTHLEYFRVREMMAVSDGTLKIKAAKQKAQKEILGQFHINSDGFGYSEDMDVLSAGDENAALLAISVLLQGDRTDAQLSDLLTAFGVDIQKDGQWNDTLTRAQIAMWADSVDHAYQHNSSEGFGKITSNVNGWGLGSAPVFEKYARYYWWGEYGLGVCGDGVKAGTVTYAKNKHTAYGIDKYDDQTQKRRFICDAKSKIWRTASDLEKDTYGWGNAADGTVRNGTVNRNLTYVYDGSAWRLGTLLDSLMYKQKIKGGKGCTKASVKDTSAIKINNVYYVCAAGIADTAYQWKVAPDLYNDTYEARGNCSASKPNSDGNVMAGVINTSKWYVCDSSLGYEWRYTTDAAEIKLGGCTGTRAADESQNYGTANGKWYICKDRKWETVNKITVDTQDWIAGSDGDLKQGDSTTSYYKYDAALDKWLETNANDVNLGLHGCTTNRTGEIGEKDGRYYACKNGSWVAASAIDYDTYGKQCSSENIETVMRGVVTASNIYYCSANGWISIMDWSWDIPKSARLNPDIEYKSFVDKRDNQVYKYVTIGTQVWMAENLNYDYNEGTAKSYCNNCAVAGRLYNWEAALKACPEGWHLPSDDEWNELAKFAVAEVGTRLKSLTGWERSNNGSDIYGFSALPVGYYDAGTFKFVGSHARYWSSEEENSEQSVQRYLSAGFSNLSRSSRSKENGLSVRCIKD